MIAEIIVDIKNSQVNQTYDYLVPVQFQEVIEVGMRVIVPFGNQKLQGFIVDIKEKSEFNKLRNILQLIDVEPVLTKELVDLGVNIAETTASFYISTFQAMLPNALKAKYKKKYRLLNDSDLVLKSLFDKKETISADQVSKDYLVILKDALKKGYVVQDVEVSDKYNKKFTKVIRIKYPDLIEQQIKSISSKSRKQIAIIETLLDNKMELNKKDLLEISESSLTTLNSLIKKDIIEEFELETYRNPYHGVIEKERDIILNEQQTDAINKINKSIENKSSDVFLLHGVTGSGKTEVYLRVIENVINQGKEAIMLVPEIALTPQMVKRFKSRFDERVAVSHSGLSIGEKYDEWRKIRRKEVSVVVGARSAIFSPFENIGVIIIDEEHETTYKQEDAPRYHALEVAKLRSINHQCPVVLGSATPSLETYARANKGVYKLIEMPKRVNDLDLPIIETVDMRADQTNLIFSQQLLTAIKEKLSKQEQIILLLNRRGYANFVLCRSCGKTIKCPHCDISMTYHKHNNQLSCHYCGYNIAKPTKCPECKSEYIRTLGFGTQRVEEELYKLIPEIKIIRMDHDTTSKKGDHQKLLDAFANHEADVLLGTQMIAKGLDFPNVTLVGVLSADTSLQLPDFRSSEKTFQLISQVAGRAGRHEKVGQVIIQTYNPSHYSITKASEHDYLSFYNQEMNIRKLGKYPPYFYITQITISSSELNKSLLEANKITATLLKYYQERILILGPVIPSVAKIKNLYRTNIIIKSKNQEILQPFLRKINEYYQNQEIYVNIDLYPQYII